MKLLKRLFSKEMRPHKKFEPMDCWYMHELIREEQHQKKTAEELVAKGVELAKESLEYHDKANLGVSAYHIELRKRKYDA